MKQSKSKQVLLNILKVASSNIATLVSGIVVGFILPKIIGVTNYGYYKTFSLYITYVGLLQFGICEGIYLKYGGYSYSELDKEKFRHYSRWLIMFEAILSIAFIFFSILVLDGEYKFIFVFVSLFLLFQNITTYYQYISQITNRFNELSIRNIIKAILTILCVLSMLLYKYIFDVDFLSYKVYTICYVMIFFVLTMWYIYTYRDITFGKKNKPNDGDSIFSLFKLGVPLLMANLCSTLALTVDRQFVSMFFDIDTYGSYAFAYNMISLITTAATSISVVIYPLIKRSNKNMLIDRYPEFSFVFILFLLLCSAAYFPLNIFMNYFFSTQPKYIESLPIFRIILPSLAITCTIGMLIQTYYKTFDLNKRYFIYVIIVLVLSILFNAGAYFIFKTTVAISWASVIVFIIWYLMISLDIGYKLKVKWKKNFIFLLIGILVFYIVSMMKNSYVAFVLYLVSIIVLALIIGIKHLKRIIEMLL